jgi:hypothetical protein
MIMPAFIGKLRKLNNRLKILGTDDRSKPLGLYYFKNLMPEYILAVDRNWLREFTEYDSVGHITHGGWRRVVQMLINKKLVSRKKAEILFSTDFNKIARKRVLEEKSIDRAIRQAADIKTDKAGNPVQDFKSDDVVDIARMIHKEKGRGE